MSGTWARRVGNALARVRSASNERLAFRSLVETLEEGVVMVDRSGALVTVNPSARRILGANLDAIVTAAKPTADTGEPRVGVPLRVNDRWLSVSTRAVDSEHGGPHAVVISFTDVTEEREARDTLEHFAYIASHDLSEPLRMISSYLTLLRRRYRGQLDADADEFIDFAVDSAGRMRGLIEGLLAFSRAGGGEEPAPVDLGGVAADVLRSLAGRMVEASAEIEISELPTVLGDRSQLEQVLQNLVGNALKFRGDGRARVWVRAEETSDGVAQIAVADAGIGIPSGEHDAVFAMFGRLNETYEGTGIGLAICRRIIERHGGRIWIEDRTGGGTVFRFTLPRV